MSNETHCVKNFNYNYTRQAISCTTSFHRVHKVRIEDMEVPAFPIPTKTKEKSE
jgi:hypothetical protein